MGRLICKYRFLIKSTIRSLLLLEVTFKVIFCVFILPLVSFGMDFVLHLWGQSYITAENVLSFLSYPYTLGLIILFVIILAVYLLTKTITMIHYCNTEKPNNKPNLPLIISVGFRKTLHCILSGNLMLPFYTILLFLLTNLPILIGIIVYAPIGLPGGYSDEMFLRGLFIFCLVLLCFIAFRGIFVIHFCINEHQSFLSSLEQSKMLLKGRNVKTTGIFLLFNLGLTVAFLLLYYVVLFITALFVYLFADKSVVITVFLSVYPRINFYTFVLFGMIAFTTNLNLISYLFTLYREEDFTELTPQDSRFDGQAMPPKGKKRKSLLTGFFLFITAAGLFNFYLTIRNDSLYMKEALSGITITSHRGNSYVAPENTLPALENAIVARSDYAEIDVQQTKDGKIILLHDLSLWRTTGLNMDIWDLTYQQVRELDAGFWFGKEFLHTVIPTLEEVLTLCKGRMKLNIEIKENGHETAFVEKLVLLLEQYDYEHQCVISSTNYDTLVKVKQLNDKIKTGFIISAVYGNFYNKKYIDFYSIRSNFLSKSVVDSAHRAGKEIHAWTVNTVSEIERMKSIGVDCIITDNPTLARKILYLNDTNKTFIELLYQMLNKRSFYRIIQN